MVGHLPGMREALGAIPSMTTNQPRRARQLFLTACLRVPHTSTLHLSIFPLLPERPSLQPLQDGAAKGQGRPGPDRTAGLDRKRWLWLLPPAFRGTVTICRLLPGNPHCGLGFQAMQCQGP